MDPTRIYTLLCFTLFYFIFQIYLVHVFFFFIRMMQMGSETVVYFEKKNNQTNEHVFIYHMYVLSFILINF